jgi:purine-nucleoside phosphorylase
MLQKINETVSFITDKIETTPDTGIILGTGLGDFSESINIHQTISYKEIPNFPHSTVESHKGNLIFGEVGGHQVVVMQGRFHYYEGYQMEEVIFPVRVMKFLGVKNLLVTNAAGGMNPSFEVGDIMVINDHINLMPNPLIGKHYAEFGDRFPDMSETYNAELIKTAIEWGSNQKFRLQKGCYVGVTGPTLETPKEYEFMHAIGGDAVGMSTIPEIIAAHQMGMKCFAASVITDLGVPGRIEKTSLQDVLNAAKKAGPHLSNLIGLILKELV